MTNEIVRYHLAPDGFGGITADPDSQNGPWVKWAVVGPEITQLRGNLSLAEDGLAAAMQEIERRDQQLKESVDHEVEYQRQIERLRAENQALRNLAANLRPGPISEALAGATAEPEKSL